MPKRLGSNARLLLAALHRELVLLTDLDDPPDRWPPLASLRALERRGLVRCEPFHGSTVRWLLTPAGEAVASSLA
ncbi:MAG: hypothetical protein IT204_25790 [Fimbriimonadaceae bacterium]|nr:hypothetical protein [Fimbriimonadaceae bacterium]